MTETERALLIWLAKYFRDGTPADPVHIQRLIVAAQSTDAKPKPIITEYPNCTVKTWVGKGGRQTPTEPEPTNPYLDNRTRSSVTPEEPKPSAGDDYYDKMGDMIEKHPIGRSHAEQKPSAGVSVEALAAFTAAIPDSWTIQQARDAKHALEAAVPYICKGKDADTATVIADNDAKMLEIERLKRSLELYRADIRVMQERETAATATISQLRSTLTGRDDLITTLLNERYAKRS